MRDYGLPQDEAIPAGIRACFRWAETGQDARGRDLDPRIVTLATNAVTEFRAKAASARAKSAARATRRR